MNKEKKLETFTFCIKPRLKAIPKFTTDLGKHLSQLFPYFLFVLTLFLMIGCSNDESDVSVSAPEPIITISRDTIVSLQNDFSAICFLESGKRYTGNVQDYSIQKDTSRILISLINNSNAITITDYFSSNDKRHVAPNAFNNVLINLGKISNEYIGLPSGFVLPYEYYVMNDNYNVRFYKYLFKAGNYFSFKDMNPRKVKLGSPASYTLVNRKTFGNYYKEYISDETEDGTPSFNSGYKVFFNEPGYLICAFRTSTGITQDGTILGTHEYILRYKIYDKI